MTNLLATEFNNHNIERLVRVSYEYVVLGVENWEGNLIAKNQMVWYIFELTNSVLQEAALDITFSTLVSYSVDLGIRS
jgi:hypothetical protein